MTTIAANCKEMAGDTRVSMEGVGSGSYASIKLFVANGSIYGVRGENCDGQIHGIEWIQSGMVAANRPDPPEDADWTILELSRNGLAIYNTWMERDLLLDRFIAIGSGAKVAMYCMKHLGMSPAEAVNEACKACDWTAAPIYVASLADPVLRKWVPSKRKGRK